MPWSSPGIGPSKRRALSHQRIACFQGFEPSKVAVCAQQDRYTVFNADGRDACVVKLPTLWFGFAGELRQDAPMLRTTVQHVGLRRSQPGFDLRERLVKPAGTVFVTGGIGAGVCRVSVNWPWRRRCV